MSDIEKSTDLLAGRADSADQVPDNDALVPNREPKPGRAIEPRSDEELARLAAHVARSLLVDAVVAVTEQGGLVDHLSNTSMATNLIAATSNGATYDRLAADGFDTVRLAAHVSDRYQQARVALGSALRDGRIFNGQLVLCAVGHRLRPGAGDLIVIADVEAASTNLALSELVTLTDGIQPQILERVVEVASRIGRIARRGRSLGALFIVGDSDHVLEGSRQLVVNPFHGHRGRNRRITSPQIDDMITEFAKLDGAFVIRGDGMIRSAGTFLEAAGVSVELPIGLGARHVAAAAVTAATRATAVAVSETDGYVRVFSGGAMVMELDPDIPML